MAGLIERAFGSPGRLTADVSHNQVLTLSGALVARFWTRFSEPAPLGLALVNRADQLIIAGVGPFFPTVAISGALAICLNPAPQYQANELAPLNAFAEWLRLGAS